MCPLARLLWQKLRQLETLNPQDVRDLDALTSDVLQRRLTHIEQTELWRGPQSKAADSA